MKAEAIHTVGEGKEAMFFEPFQLRIHLPCQRTFVNIHNLELVSHDVEIIPNQDYYCLHLKWARNGSKSMSEIKITTNPHHNSPLPAPQLLPIHLLHRTAYTVKNVLRGNDPHPQ